MGAKIANVQEVDPNSLKFYGRNAKIHGEDQINALIHSIKEFGFVAPCLIDADLNLIAGHGRVMAARKMGLKTVPCVLIEGLTPQQRRAYIMADNRLAEMAEWDMDIVTSELQALQLEDFDISVIGFDFDLKIDMGDSQKKPEEDDFEDDPAEPDIVKPGQIWSLGRHRLMCGDSTSDSDLARLMNGAQATMVFADPPYGMKKETVGVNGDNLNYDDLLEFNKKWIPLSFRYMIPAGSWYCFGIDEPLMDIYSNILRPMKKEVGEKKLTFRNLLTWDKGGGMGQRSQDFRKYAVADEKCLFVMRGRQTYGDTKADYWDGFEPIRLKLCAMKDRLKLTTDQVCKIAGASTCSHWFSRSQWEIPAEERFLIFLDNLREQGYVSGPEYDELRHEYDELRHEYDELRHEYDELRHEFYKTRAYFDNTHDNMNSVWHFNTLAHSTAERGETGGHATPKPIALVTRAVRSSSREGDIVLDPFGGSGSTLIACENENRICFMNELDPHWCSVIIRRWQKHTGKEARLIDGNE